MSTYDLWPFGDDGPTPDEGPVPPDDDGVIDAEEVSSRPPDVPVPETVACIAGEVHTEAIARYDITREQTEGREIKDDEEWAAVAERMRDNATFVKMAKARFKPAIDKAQEALDAIRAVRDGAIEPAEREQKLLKLLWDTYDTKRTKRLAAEREEELKKARERADEQAKAEAAALRAAGHEEAAKIVEQSAPDAPLVIAPRVEEKPTGVSTRSLVGIEIVDRMALLNAIVARMPGTTPDWIRFDETAIKALARALGPAFNIPGVVRTEKSSVSVRSR